MSPTEARGRVWRIAPRDSGEALRIARAIDDPWFRCQALAAAARFAAEADVEEVAREALRAGAAAGDGYRSAAVAAWPIRALVERGRLELAAASLGEARARALAASPNSSRAAALLTLLEGSWGLGMPVRRQLIEDLLALHASDGFWRIRRSLVDALVLLATEDRDLARQLAGQIEDQGCRRRFETVLEARREVGPRSFFQP